MARARRSGGAVERERRPPRPAPGWACARPSRWRRLLWRRWRILSRLSRGGTPTRRAPRVEALWWQPRSGALLSEALHLFLRHRSLRGERRAQNSPCRRVRVVERGGRRGARSHAQSEGQTQSCFRSPRSTPLPHKGAFLCESRTISAAKNVCFRFPRHPTTGRSLRFPTTHTPTRRDMRRAWPAALNARDTDTRRPSSTSVCSSTHDTRHNQAAPSSHIPTHNATTELV